MRIATFLIALTVSTLAGTAPAQGIAEVLRQSQQQRLARFDPADLQREEARRLQATWARLNALLAEQGLAPADLHLVAGGLFAEARFGQLAVAAGLGVGELPEGERAMVLAHELGHLHLGHWEALRALYQQHIPGAVRPDTTDAVAGALGQAAHALSHEQELAADAFGLALLHRLGFDATDACSLLLRQGVQPDTATHPATRKRVAQLRWLDAQRPGQRLVMTGAPLPRSP